MAVSSTQLPFSKPYNMHEWAIELSNDWDVLGPFPISAREQHFLSPSFPLNLSTPYLHEPSRTWPSSLADGGEVGWRTITITEVGHLTVSHPHIRWDTLRTSEGWAALQHHNVLRTTMKLIPPTGDTVSLYEAPLLACTVRRASFFALIPEAASDETEYVIKWYPGDIYAFKNSPSLLLTFPNVPYTHPTIFHLFIAGDYEVRLFGDPAAVGARVPELDISFHFDLVLPENRAVFDPGLHVIPDFVDGWAFGFAIGIGVRAIASDCEVVSVGTNSSALLLSLLNIDNYLVSTQTRIIPIAMDQTAPFFEEDLQVSVVTCIRKTGQEIIYNVNLPVKQRDHWQNIMSFTAIKGSYLLKGIPTPFIAIPPSMVNKGEPRPPIIALHGAGVEVSDGFWSASLPRQHHSWIICPTGLTSWGLDWHGASADDVWGSLEAVTALLSVNRRWHSWRILEDTRVVTIGHSNGGQGTWYLMTRYPDKVFAGIPVAAYIKSQQYVPLSLSRGSHFIDPALAAVYAAALTPDDNDLFVTNVIGTSILSIHGGADENVPTWHSRELVGLVRTWRPDADASFLEFDNMPHWDPEVFRSQRVQSFLSIHLNRNNSESIPAIPQEFVLTVAIPNESGSLHGFSVRELEIPGRLARLRIFNHDNMLQIRTNNVQTFSFIPRNWRVVAVDGIKFDISERPAHEVWFSLQTGLWKVLNVEPSIRPIGPISRILRFESPILVIVPQGDPQALSIAGRLAHALLLSFRVDTYIMTDYEASLRNISELGSMIIIGSNNNFGLRILQSGPKIVKLSPGEFTVHHTVFNDSTLGIVFVHPHPSSSREIVVFVCGTDSRGLEKAARLLLPIRTGVPLPEFIVIGKEADTKASGGVHAAGFWTRSWEWSDTMGWINQIL